MSDEMKHVETEIPKAEPSSTLPEQELEQVVGGTSTTDKASTKLYELSANGKHIAKIKLEYD